ncbi:hypothetical protein CYMTET_50567 [Cymbomonas tetramitiformis]|uniref:Uncharacterized protein n=1 Tax=Cymbomonas tetramitiformis TaxID=36881 RepID=A0AAE0ETC7_9CHLO|nr:hypothetical protein CYMTET_50567 [Cymbomonas tetramitiformis]
MCNENFTRKNIDVRTGQTVVAVEQGGVIAVDNKTKIVEVQRQRGGNGPEQLTSALAMPTPEAAWHHQSKCVLEEGVERWKARWKILGEGS